MANYVDKMKQSSPLDGIFTAIPHCYDLVNQVITLGLDKRWRNQAARECLAAQPEKVLDLCCGSGDLVISIARLAQPRVELMGVDYNQAMLELAANKAEGLAGKRKIIFSHGAAANLPFPDGYFDCVAISFAFRNLTYKNPLAQPHLAAILRLLNSGGRCVIVETSQPKGRLIRQLFHLYLRWFVFPIGYLLSANRQAYRYLAESASRFYGAEEVSEMLLKAGFRQVSFRPLFLGAIAIHVAIK